MRRYSGAVSCLAGPRRRNRLLSRCLSNSPWGRTKSRLLPDGFSDSSSVKAWFRSTSPGRMGLAARYGSMASKSGAGPEGLITGIGTGGTSSPDGCGSPPSQLTCTAADSRWKRLLACLYGGLYEEILSRLFLLTLIAWLANKALRKPDAQLSPAAFWIANLVVAILFGLGHLPSASLVMPITPLVVAVALILNGIAAVPFGVLYRRRGLEAAMIAHFTADFVIYVVGPGFMAT